MNQPIGDSSLVFEIRQAVAKIKTELEKRIVGQKAVIDDLLACFFAGGHCLIIGVPGLAKTTLVHCLAQCLSLKFNRIQFTPDLMPSDITGSEILFEDRTSGNREFRFVKGPIFCNIMLADEINRTPPKTQSALLQAMQEREVTSSGVTFSLPSPFWVLATQNPIEQEGTYPLPEAQQDRFMFSIEIGYPDVNEELEIVRTTTVPQTTTINALLDAGQIETFRGLVWRVPVADSVLRAAVTLARSTRQTKSVPRDFANSSPGAPGRGHHNTSCLPQRPMPCSTGVPRPTSTILRARPIRSSGTGLSGRFMRKRKE